MKILSEIFFARLTAIHGCFYHRLFIICLLISSVNAPVYAQAKENGDVQKFEIISRKPVTAPKDGLLAVKATSATSFYELVSQAGKPVFKIHSDGKEILIDALGNIEYAQKAGRIVTFGDSLQKHVGTEVYVNFYTNTGSLIKSLGRLGTFPYIATLSENGNFIIAGNRNEQGQFPAMFFASFDKNGNKQWEKSMDYQIPIGIFNSYNNKYTALVLFHPHEIRGHVEYYNAQGVLLYVDHNHRSAATIEFLPSEKIVICTENVWHLYDIATGFKLVASGILPGKTIGKYPVSAHPSKNMFFILTRGKSGNNSYSIQAFNSLSGALIAETEFAGKIDWQNYRMLEALPDGTIHLLTMEEIISLKMSER